MTTGVHKLAALRLLSQGMSRIERQRRQRIERGEDPAEVNRDAAQLALTRVVGFFQSYGIDSGPLISFLEDLVALTGGAKPSRMLTPGATRHCRPDAPTVEAIKGRLAAIMEFRQKAGLSRKAAGEWVVRQLSSTMKRQLRASTRAAVDGWLVKWGGRRGATSGSGRDGYLHMRAILKEKSPTEAQLKKIIAVLARSLPS
jgi:hypothetical protein